MDNALNDCYSPHTGEHIANAVPAPWMGRAGKAPPTYDAQTQGCFWRSKKWVVEDVVPAVEYKTVFAPRDFLARFTMSEYAAVRASANPAAQYALDNLIGAQYVDLDDPTVAAGLDLMLAEGIISAERRDELLAPEEL